MSQSIVVCRDINKSYRDVRALTDVSLTIRKKAVHVVAGANGAGKTTLFRILVGQAQPDSGSLVGSDLQGGRMPAFAYQPEVPGVYDYLTIREFLQLASRLGGGHPTTGVRKKELIHRFSLDHAVDKLGIAASAGTRQKASVLAALVQDADVYVLDEPTNHLDAGAVHVLKDELRAMRRMGKTVLLATHVLDFAENVADDITTLDNGRVRFSGAVADLPGAGSLETRVAESLGFGQR